MPRTGVDRADVAPDLPGDPYAGKASTQVTFSEPGDYILAMTGNDLSGDGGGGSGCCWTNAFIKVAVN